MHVCSVYVCLSYEGMWCVLYICVCIYIVCIYIGHTHAIVCIVLPSPLLERNQLAGKSGSGSGGTKRVSNKGGCSILLDYKK